MNAHHGSAEAADRFGRLLSFRDLVTLTGLSSATLRRMRKSRALPAPLQLSPGRVAWPETTISTWLASRRRAILGTNAAPPADSVQGQIEAAIVRELTYAGLADSRIQVLLDRLHHHLGAVPTEQRAAAMFVRYVEMVDAMVALTGPGPDYETWRAQVAGCLSTTQPTSSAMLELVSAIPTILGVRRRSLRSVARRDTTFPDRWLASFKSQEPPMAQVLVKHWKIAVLWVASLVLVGVVVARAQPPLERPPITTAMPEIVSGSDVGFRIDRTVNGIPQGAIVVRVGGKWVEVAPNRR